MIRGKYWVKEIYNGRTINTLSPSSRLLVHACAYERCYASRRRLKSIQPTAFCFLQTTLQLLSPFIVSERSSLCLWFLTLGIMEPCHHGGMATYPFPAM